MDAYPPNSRYARVAVRRYVAPDGREVTYLAARPMPQLERYTPLALHRIEVARRLDLLADHYYGDPEQYWRICDANGVFWPPLATARPRAALVIPLPLELADRGDT